jgi:NADPH-dependent curcumin reductase CurA
LSGWEKFSVVAAERVRKVKKGVPLATNLSIFSHIGYAAASGMIAVGDVTERDTVVVSAAAGATGSIAAQIAKSRGARVLGIAGGTEKCQFLTDELGLDAAIDYKSEDVEQRLAQLCPAGVSLFFDNVGGAVLDAVLMNLTQGARVALCGQIATYDSCDRSDGQGVRNLMQLVFRSARMEGFIAGQFTARMQEFDDELTRIYRAGALICRTHIVEGLENAAEALNLLLSGQNEGKLMVQVSPAPVPSSTV